MSENTPTKVCTKCHTPRGLGLFRKRASASDGLDSWCKDCRKDHQRAWEAKNKDKRLAYHKAWVSENKEQYLAYAQPIWNANSARWRASCRTRVYPEYLEQIREIYRGCPEGHHVDHIVPLHGDLVSGLHVPWNLQYLPASENQRKSNIFLVE